MSNHMKQPVVQPAAGQLNNQKREDRSRVYTSSQSPPGHVQPNQQDQEREISVVTSSQSPSHQPPLQEDPWPAGQLSDQGEQQQQLQTKTWIRDIKNTSPQTPTQRSTIGSTSLNYEISTKSILISSLKPQTATSGTNVFFQCIINLLK